MFFTTEKCFQDWCAVGTHFRLIFRIPKICFLSKFYFRKCNLVTFHILIKKIALLYFICETELEIMANLAKGFKSTSVNFGRSYVCFDFSHSQSRIKMGLGLSKCLHERMNFNVCILSPVLYSPRIDHSLTFQRKGAFGKCKVVLSCCYWSCLWEPRK